jgi:hypothetical protein
MITVGELAVPAHTLADPDQLGTDGYGVLCDDSGPVALVWADDPAGGPATLSPVLLLPAEMGLAALAESPLLVLLEEYPELPGFVVVDPDGDPVGILPVEVLDEYLGSGRYEPRPSVMGPGGYASDVDVPGDVRLPKARVRCRAAGCGYVNTLTYLDSAHPPRCANPDLAGHPLAIAGV